jgi:hypothetical protein
MPSLPEASIRIDDAAGSFATGVDRIVVISPVATSADTTPRSFASTQSLLDQHAYSQGASYVATHIQDTGKPVVFVGIPIATAGTAGQLDTSTVTGTCNITVTAAASGYLEEVDGILTVVTGGTVGTAGIVLSLSLDGGTTEKTIKLGTATSYTVPYLGIVLNFQTGGTLVVDDVFRFRTTAPMWDSAGLLAARTALAAQLKLSRSWMVIGEVPTDTLATVITTAVNAYESENDRFVYARTNIKDRSPLARMSKSKVSMVGSPSVTFAEVGATGDTVTRATGSFVTDGFLAGMWVVVTGTASNNGPRGRSDERREDRRVRRPDLRRGGRHRRHHHAFARLVDRGRLRGGRHHRDRRHRVQQHHGSDRGAVGHGHHAR